MTLVATYRLDDRAVYLNDFRLTIKNPDRQLDASFKFQSFDNRMGLLLAGDIYLWKLLLPFIERTVSSINLDNVLKADGPFHEAIQIEAEKCPSDSYGKTGAIGFLVDGENNQNVQFRIDVSPGLGCIVEPIPIGTCVIIGSGASIPNIENRIKTRVEKDINIHGNDLYKVGTSMRNEMLETLKLCGSSSFSKLGISPCMAISTLTKSSFVIWGEEVDGCMVSQQSSHFYHFEFHKNDIGEVVLEDQVEERTQIINDISKMNENLPGEIFDPQNLTKGNDASELFSSAEVVYLFEQWLIPEINAVRRSIDAITCCKFKDKPILHPDRRRIVGFTENGLSAEELGHYTNLQKHYFIINNEAQCSFEQDMQTKMFNHNWLALRFEWYHLFYTNLKIPES
ncbi:hypothetical protein CEB3_c33880 [Peptococcaceae bacterium CEB3]|nr:hypothetical protein CEB3_c33880 [Peptococcaceae bacterium CEB3]